MHNKKVKIIIGVVLIFTGIALLKGCSKQNTSNGEKTIEIQPAIGTIQNSVSTTGTVLPKNRLEVKPPVNGRIEKILVREGDTVTAGQPLALMSSTERAALLDAARAQGEESVRYWEDVYKAISLISPIAGEVIVATTQPGQTVTISDAVIVLSDQLIARAQVDETDIGKIKLGQGAVIILDAYPDAEIKAKVEHIYYESKTVNNVTIYEVDLVPEHIPPFFRSGMSATINFIVNSKSDMLIIPVEAVIKENDTSYVLVKQKNKREPIRRSVELGITDDKNVEIVSGIGAEDTVMVKTKKFSLPKSDTGTNPFMPGRRRTTR